MIILARIKHIDYFFFLAIVAFSGCSPYKSYTFEDSENVKRMAVTGQSTLDGKGHKLVKYYTYHLPQRIFISSRVDSIIPYVNTVYKKTHKKDHHPYVNDMEIIQVGDSMIYFKFKYPTIIHGKESYWYDRRKGCIFYTLVYTGKF